jgi:hypothetical protein
MSSFHRPAIYSSVLCLYLIMGRCCFKGGLRAMGGANTFVGSTWNAFQYRLPM